jgi:hypothetical protein
MVSKEFRGEDNPVAVFMGREPFAQPFFGLVVLVVFAVSMKLSPCEW